MLKLTDVTKVFNKGTVNEKTALNHVSLTVNDGDFITLLGSNGAGKSTLFNAIAGDFRIDEGKIELDDKNITFLPNYKRAVSVGRLFQDPLKGTAPHMTIEENLTLAYLRASSNRADFSRITEKDREFFSEKLKKLDMGLEDRMKTEVGTLSGGQRQALTLLMATIVPPKILLLDEHTAALDPVAAEKIMKLTEEIVKENHTTCLLITHNMNHALSIGNRTLIMNNGRILSDLNEEEKKNMSVESLIYRFQSALNDDRILLGDEV